MDTPSPYHHDHRPQSSAEDPPPPSTNASTPLNNNCPDFLSSVHYKEWARNLDNSTRKTDTLLKFAYQCFLYGGETVSLIVTLFFGLVLPTGDQLQTVYAIGFYLITCIVSVAVSHGNKTVNNAGYTYRPYTWKRFFLNCLFLLKPVRYWKVFRTRRVKVAVIKRESVQRDGVPRINKNGLLALVDIYEEEIQDKMVERNEAMFQSIPMALIQLYFMFSTHQTFQLCSKEDVTRILTILFSVWHGAQAVTNFDIASYEYQGSLHFLSFYLSNGAHPMRVYPGGLINCSNMMMLVSNYCTMFAVFYVSAFFLNASVWLCLLFLGIIFIGNTVVIFMFPLLEEKYCNAPVGAHTWVSYLVQRLMNIFSASGTRFQKFSHKQFRICNYKYNIPFVFVQLVVFVVAIVVTSIMGSDYMSVFLKSITKSTAPKTNQTVEELLDECSEASETDLNKLYGFNKWTKAIGDYLFPVYEQAEGHFSHVSDLFNLIHFNWLLMYVGVLATCVFAYSDLRRRMKDPSKLRPGEDTHFKEVYPILSAYGFYRHLIGKVLENNTTNRLGLIRKLMVLTVVDQSDFMKLVRIFWIFPKIWLSNRSVDLEVDRIIRGFEENDMEVDLAISTCFKMNHPFGPEFVKIYGVICQSTTALGANKRLFLRFFADFDRNMYSTSSWRIRTVFSLLGVGGVQRE